MLQFIQYNCAENNHEPVNLLLLIIIISSSSSIL